MRDLPDARFETRVIHAGQTDPPPEGAVVMPIFQSAMYRADFDPPDAQYHDVRYIRLSNTPNHRLLHARLADLEGAESALVTASGMAAIATALLTVLEPGDHLIAQNCLYGGTRTFITQDLRALGIETTFVDATDPESWPAALRPRTRAVYVETISNPLMEVPELAAVVEFARAHDLVSMIDNTLASPALMRPPELGFDLSLHSATKYLNGHSDIVAGAVIGRGDLVRAVSRRLAHLGGSLDPHAAFLLGRGMMTLALRMERHCHNAMRVAEFLQAHPAVRRVNYPGLPSSPHHERARRYLDGASGMLSFEIEGGRDAAERLIALARIPTHAPSLGGVETLLTRPAATSHRGLSPEEREAAGVSDSLVRMSVGIESADDLVADLEQALTGATGTRAGGSV